jgi:transcriptional regulator with XRE-family HTH domain
LSRIESDKGGLTIDSLYRLAVVLGIKELAKYLRPFTSEGKSETL